MSSKKKTCIICKNVTDAELFEVSLLGGGTVLRFERDIWSMAK